MNEKIMSPDDWVLKRIYNLTLTFRDGALPSKTKEMFILATSLVLRRDECIKYHLERCFECGSTT